MKAAAFEYACPADAAAACALLAAGDGMAKPIAGGQSLGPMLNLRLAQPDSLVDLSGIASLVRPGIAGIRVMVAAEDLALAGSCLPG